MPRLASTIRGALDELDRPWPADEIDGAFVRRVRVVVGSLPAPCVDSIARVAAALAHQAGNALPAGSGGACVRHFVKRSEQLESILKVSLESRFALIELAALAGIAGGWSDWREPRISAARHKDCLRDAVDVEAALGDREHWRVVIRYLLHSPSSLTIVIRNVAYALMWCGCFAAGPVTDEQLAQQVFREDRATYVRSRLEALRWLPKLLEISLLPAGGAP